MPENLKKKYKVTFYDMLLCWLMRKITGSRIPRQWLRKYALKKYGYEDRLGRYWQERYCGRIIGKYTYGYENLQNDMVKSIGAFCSIGEAIRVVPNDHVPEWITTSPITTGAAWGFVEKNLPTPKFVGKSRDIHIGNDVWIGAGVTLFQGVTIGDGAIIGTNSIIRKNIPPYAVVVGTDRIIKYRFDKDTIARLLKMQWWKWDDKKIKENIFALRDVEAFLKIK